LKRLRTDDVDLYQIHRPAPRIAWEEQVSALDSLVQQGKMRYVGCSTHPAWAVMNAIMVSELKGCARISSNNLPTIYSTGASKMS
jgi:aryl-alcohol dehydrogenase-like predicted oxidoreductase